LPAVLTLIDEDEAPVLHNNAPVEVVDNVEVPLQLLTTFTTGVDGVVFGAAVPVPCKLVQPFTVVVRV
jgi:putative N-acetylmannosamine-6-phosphate epimerase